MRLTAGVFVIVSSHIGLSARDARGETFEWLSVTVAPGSTLQTLSARAALRFRGPRNGTTERWTWDVDGPPVQFTARTRFDEPLLTRWDSSHDPPEITFDMSPPVITTDRATGQPLERRHAEISLVGVTQWAQNAVTS